MLRYESKILKVVKNDLLIYLNKLACWKRNLCLHLGFRGSMGHLLRSYLVLIELTCQKHHSLGVWCPATFCCICLKWFTLGMGIGPACCSWVCGSRVSTESAGLWGSIGPWMAPGGKVGAEGPYGGVFSSPDSSSSVASFSFVHYYKLKSQLQSM